MTKVEMGVGLPAVLILNFFDARIGGPVLEHVVTGIAGAAWLGIMALGMVAGTMLVDATVARVAVEAERPKHVLKILYGAVAALMLGGMLQAAMPGFGVCTLIVLGGAAAWAVSCAMLAFHGSNVGDEIGAGKRKRTLAAPKEATDDEAPRVDPKLRARAQRHQQLGDALLARLQPLMPRGGVRQMRLRLGKQMFPIVTHVSGIQSEDRPAG
jgi:hypothetical protein